MTNVFELSVPLEVDIETGNNWYGLKVGDKNARITRG